MNRLASHCAEEGGDVFTFVLASSAFQALRSRLSDSLLRLKRRRPPNRRQYSAVAFVPHFECYHLGFKEFSTVASEVVAESVRMLRFLTPRRTGSRELVVGSACLANG